MEFRRNIIFSAVLHTMIILSAFAVSVSVGDMTEHLRTDYLTVSLFKEMTGTTSVNSPLPVPDNKTRFLTKAQNDKSEETASKNSPDKVDITISANQHADISEETNISHSTLKENESNHPLTLLDPSLSSLSNGEIKEGMGGLQEQDSDSENTGKSQSGDKILEST